MRDLRFYLLVSGACLIALYGIIEAIYVVHMLGLGSVLSVVKPPGELKNGLSLTLTLSLLSSILALASAVSSGFWSTSLSVVAVVLGITLMASIKIMGFPTTSPLEVLGLSSIAVLSYGSGLSSIEALRQPAIKMSSFEVASVAMFSALTAVTTAFTGQFFPSPTGGYTHVGDAVIFIASLMLGPKLGALVGAVGAVAADFYVGYPRWFISIPAHGLEGFIAGLGKGRKIHIQMVLCALGGLVMALTYFYVNIFVKGIGPASISLFRDVFGQVTVSLIIASAIKPVLSKMAPKRI